MKKTQLAVIGGGPAGMAAALQAHKEGIKDIIIFERDNNLGGILQQCIHDGFGLHYFKEQLTGPEYACRFEEEIEKHKIKYKLNTMVINIDNNKKITVTNEKDGIEEYQCNAIILAMGCRERTRGAIGIPGTRPAGVLTAGTVQRFINIEGYMPGKKVVILGSGDIGLIMARRLTFEGAEVKMVCELMPYSNGLTRNIVQCLEDYDIPLKYSHTVIEIHGKERVKGVTIAKVDEKMKPILDTAEYIECDLLVLSVGLIPENELSFKAEVNIHGITGGPEVNSEMSTNVKGIFACGNVLHVHDLVDYVSEEAELAAIYAANYIKGMNEESKKTINVQVGNGVRYVLPDKIVENNDEKIKILFRVSGVYKDCKVVVESANQNIYNRKKIKVTPGEMEKIILKRKDIEEFNSITVRIDEG